GRALLAHGQRDAVRGDDHRAPVDAELPHVLPEPGVARPAARQEGADGADARGAEGPEPRRDPARGADALGDRLRVLRAATGDVVGGDLHRVPGRGPPRPTGPPQLREPPAPSGPVAVGTHRESSWRPERTCCRDVRPRTAVTTS